jgi:hypothetical protein
MFEVGNEGGLMRFEVLIAVTMKFVDESGSWIL